MPHDVIMPALGMAQDTGKLVGWLKQPGDPVAVGDPIMEVETDKTTMEVEAQADGFLTRVSAAAGEDVPVGQVVAVIAESAEDEAAPDTAPETETAPETADSPASEPPPASAQPEVAPANEAASPPQVAAPAEPGGRILASPKARRLAMEAGLDLKRLADHGVPQPYHVADFDTLKSLGPAEARDATPAPASAAQPMHIAARTGASAFDDFVAWLAGNSDIPVAPRLIWLRLATAALREAGGNENGPLIVETRTAAKADGRFVDADRYRLSDPAADESDRAPDLILRDFSATPIVAMTGGATAAPVLTIARDGNTFLFSLDFTGEQLDEDRAIAFITAFASRMDNPLGHIV